MNWDISVTSKKADATRNILVSFVDQLATDELLTGTPTVTEQSTSALTITDAALNTVESMLWGQKVVTSQGVTFSVSGGVARSSYTIRVTVETTGSPAQTLVKDMRLLIL